MYFVTQNPDRLTLGYLQYFESNKGLSLEEYGENNSAIQPQNTLHLLFQIICPLISFKPNGQHFRRKT